MLTREEFEALRRKNAREMGADKALQKDALSLLVKAIPHQWIQQTTWFGEPVLQLPQDLFSLQEIIFRTRPDYIVEIGVAWAGSLLFYSTLMEVLGGKGVIGVDVYIPEDLKARIKAAGRVADRITLLQESSINPATIAKIQKLTGGSKALMVHLDSDHTHAHVLKELNLYAPLVGKGHYLICGDTHVESLPPGTHGQKPYGPGNNPKTALDEFLKSPAGKGMEIDAQFQDKYLFSLNPGGYLVRRGG